jgi:hypothetical protein
VTSGSRAQIEKWNFWACSFGLAFGFARYKTKWHNNGATWAENRAEKAATERDQVAAAIDPAVSPAVHPLPMQGQVQRPWGASRQLLSAASVSTARR